MSKQCHGEHLDLTGGHILAQQQGEDGTQVGRVCARPERLLFSPELGYLLDDISSLGENQPRQGVALDVENQLGHADLEKICDYPGGLRLGHQIFDNGESKGFPKRFQQALGCPTPGVGKVQDLAGQHCRTCIRIKSSYLVDREGRHYLVSMPQELHELGKNEVQVLVGHNSV